MKYIGTKTISATPAWRIDGKVYPKDGEVPRSMNREDGYKVVHEDGYESWSPKDVFEKAYKPADTPEERVIIELGNLQEKINKLGVFIDSDKFSFLRSDVRALLQAQYDAMKSYYGVLGSRYYRMQESKDAFIASFYNFSFGVAICLLKAGLPLRRNGWNGKGLFVIKQVPAHISNDIIPNMQSLPQAAKERILKSKGFIDYTSQCLIYNENTGRADSWVPSISDVFAEDWELVV